MRDFLKKITNFTKNHPVIMGVALVSLIVPASVWAWGPNRKTFTIEKPADYVTFNSITNSPVIGGDERDFVGIREVGTQNAWSNNVKVRPGKEYYVRIYVHNNAASNLNLVAENVVAKMNVPTNTGKSITVQGQVSASNANPTSVWDEATFSSDQDFNLAYVAGSALYENNSMKSAKLGDSIVTNSGVKLGYDKLDGRIPGCFQYAGYVTLKVKPQFAQQPETPEISLSKTVRNKTNGEKSWSEVVNAKSGDTVQFQIEAKNAGKATINNLVLRDVLPKGLEYVADSAKLYNKTNPKGLKIDNSIIANSGVNVGAYTAGSNAFVRFDAKVSSNDKLPVCGENTLTNLAQASNQKIVRNDTASVKVNKTCETPKPTPKPQPTYKCEALRVKMTKTSNGTDEKGNNYTNSTYEFNTNYTVKNTQFTGVKYVVKNSKGEIVSEKTVNNGSKFEFTVKSYASEKFTVKATVITQNGENSNTNCEATFQTPAPQPKPTPVPEPKKPELVCNNITITQISRTKFEFNTSYTVKNTNFIGVKYIVKNASGKVVINKTVNNGSKLTIDIAIVGKFTVSSTIITKDGQNSNSNCEKTFEVKQENKPAIVIKKTVNGGELLKIDAEKEFNYEITVSNTGNVDLQNVVVSDNAPANITFISSDSGKIANNVLTDTVKTLKVGESKTITIKSKATASGIKTTNTACVNTTTIPGDKDGCDSADVEVPKKETPAKPNNPTPSVPAEPQLPNELPQTGADALSVVAGIVSLTLAFGYYFASRKQL